MDVVLLSFVAALIIGIANTLVLRGD